MLSTYRRSLSWLRKIFVLTYIGIERYTYKAIIRLFLDDQIVEYWKHTIKTEAIHKEYNKISDTIQSSPSKKKQKQMLDTAFEFREQRLEI